MAERCPMNKIRGCGKQEIDFFVPVSDGKARAKKGLVRFQHHCGQDPFDGVFVCGYCAKRQGLVW